MIDAYKLRSSKHTANSIDGFLSKSRFDSVYKPFVVFWIIIFFCFLK